MFYFEIIPIQTQVGNFDGINLIQYLGDRISPQYPGILKTVEKMDWDKVCLNFPKIKNFFPTCISDTLESITPQNKEI